MGWLPASRHILLRPGQKPGVWCVTGGSWAVGPYSWGLVGWSRESGCLSKREPQTGGIEQGGSGRVVRAAGPDTEMPPPPPFLRRKDPRRRHATGAGREWPTRQEPVPAKIDEQQQQAPSP